MSSHKTSGDDAGRRTVRVERLEQDKPTPRTVHVERVEPENQEPRTVRVERSSGPRSPRGPPAS